MSTGTQRAATSPAGAADQPAVTVIIAHTRTSIVECLESLRRQTYPLDRIEAIVVGANPGHLASRDFGFAVRYLEMADLSPARRRNHGIAAAASPILAFLDDDATAAPDWIANAAARFAENPRLGLLGGPAFLPAGVGLRHKLTFKLAHAGFFGNGHENLSKGSGDINEILGYLASCNLFIHAGRLVAVEPYDPRLAYGGEDTLFVYENYLRHHCEVEYQINIVVFHSRGPFGIKFLKRRFQYRQNNGRMLWRRPEIYLRNAKFRVGVILATLCCLSPLWRPFAPLVIVTVHQSVALLYALRYRKEDWRLIFLFPPALLIHHVVYYAGIVTGLVSALMSPRVRSSVEEATSS